VPKQSVNNIEEKLRGLRNSYIQHLPGKIKDVQKLWNSLCNGWQNETIDELHRIVHSLAGSAGTFGFAQMGEIARSADNILKNYRDTEMPPHNSVKDELEDIFEKLSSICNSITEQAEETKDSTGLDVGYKPDHKNSTVKNRIFMVDDDNESASELALQIEQFGYEVTVFNSIEAFKKEIAVTPPTAVIMDVVFPEGEFAGIEAVRKIQRQRAVHLPVIYVSTYGDLKSRLNAVRSGGDAYLTKPIDINMVVETLDILTSFHGNDSYRILIVDDDKYLAEHYATVLRNADLDVKIVNDPMDIMNVLVDFNPELILMDIYMPGCTGLELAKVIRQNVSYLNLPIVFLSTETGQEQQYAALRMGGDDFLTKPIDEGHLISSVISRAQRSRKLAEAITRDSLTGLLNHAKLRDQLDIEVLRAERQGTNLTFAMIDIDFFKKVNDNYGHVVGDHVIRDIARTLNQQLRRTDIIGRYGGEEFAVILPDTDEKSAKYALDKIREEYAQKHHAVGKEHFNITFSCGISGISSSKSAEAIVVKADEALYEAKKKGRNCIVILP